VQFNENEKMKISVREMKENDIEQIVEYFSKATPEFLLGMGVDPNKLPSKKKWIGILQRDLRKKNNEKENYYIIWQIGEQSIGHSKINKIKFAKEAYMHLHLWRKDNRQRGIGLQLLKETLPFYFRNFKLQELICEPYSLNPAANKTLVKVGFEFIKEYEATPGWINFHQKVNRYVMTKDRFEEKVEQHTTKN
jgi:RimJ/RimL family protein N-acetyltransferase